MTAMQAQQTEHRNHGTEKRQSAESESAQVQDSTLAQQEQKPTHAVQERLGQSYATTKTMIAMAI
jgi:hypothetical protein